MKWPIFSCACAWGCVLMRVGKLPSIHGVGSELDAQEPLALQAKDLNEGVVDARHRGVECVGIDVELRERKTAGDDAAAAFAEALNLRGEFWRDAVFDEGFDGGAAGDHVGAGGGGIVAVEELVGGVKGDLKVALGAHAEHGAGGGLFSWRGRAWGGVGGGGGAGGGNAAGQGDKRSEKKREDEAVGSFHKSLQKKGMMFGGTLCGSGSARCVQRGDDARFLRASTAKTSAPWAMKKSKPPESPTFLKRGPIVARLPTCTMRVMGMISASRPRAAARV